MFIGLDLGTSGLKALLITQDQRIVAEANATLDVLRPHDGWSEQAAQDWVGALNLVMGQLASDQDLGGVRAIGLSGQMHGATCYDAAGTPLRPSILWNDTRAAAEAQEMDATPAFRRTSGNIVFPGFTAPKIAWMRTHEPDLFARIDKVLLPKDALRLHLCGEAISEMSDASGTAWLDVGARDWDDDLLAHTGLSRSHMPRLVEGSEPAGTLRETLAQEWGLPKGVIIAGGGGDNAATAIGAGVTRAGQAFVSLGTSGVLFAACDAYQPQPETAVHTFAHALPDTWHQMGVILAATDALNWYANLVGSDAASLDAALGTTLAAPGRSLFLPYLGGERTPINNARVRGAFVGLDHATDQVVGTRAVVEGVTHALRDSYDALRATGTSIESLIAMGGGSKSRYWLHAIATSLNIPVQIPKAGDFGAAFGAARLAMMADGASSDIAHPPEIIDEILPDETLVDAFDEAHTRYKSTYAALKDIS